MGLLSRHGFPKGLTKAEEGKKRQVVDGKGEGDSMHQYQVCDPPPI